ncbi:AraC family transcriptional regulator [Rubellicoccus peritrichatus]|uniref:AraC family transcriptional regulator n=1 Tax=Rubellicoccus peritrichatus TaxID=3080537 RepID=A0AAQ3L780_9BACT|nr:AraC family transcriptional regulator [Puniceicoccus sp. CR14]WOO40595.1 AraC family transcriptional regulator [Puniceicoccus sp. CR14]
MQKSDSLPNTLNQRQRDTIRLLLEQFQVEIISAVYWRNEAPWYLDLRKVHDSFFLFPVKGELHFYSEGQCHSVKPGQFVMLADGVEHAIELKDGHSKLEQIAIHAYIQNIWQMPFLSLCPNVIGTLPNKASWFLEMKEFIHVLNLDKVSGQQWGEGLIRRLLISQITQFDLSIAQEVKNIDPRIEAAVLKIHNHYKDGIMIEQLAEDCRLSTVQFRKLFLRYTGLSPKIYLEQYRLKKAAFALKNTASSIKRIAADVAGLNNVQYFHAVFKKAYGMTPSQYRNTPTEGP